MTHRMDGGINTLLEERIMERLEEEASNPLGYWYLSFADKDKGFLGGAIVEARGFASAVLCTKELKINPGGEVMGMPIPEDKIPPTESRNRLLSKPELETVWGRMVKLSTHEEA